MARKHTSSRPSRPQPEEELDLDEIDEFHTNQEEILLDQAGIKRKAATDDYELSDEEVLGLPGSEDDSDEFDDGDQQMEDLYDDGNDDADDTEEGWGSSKKNYYGADTPKDDEDAKLEEEEALRLQKAHLAELAADDYFEEDDVEDWKKSAKETDELSTTLGREELPDQDPSVLDDTERLNLLKSWYPEVLPLAEELNSLSPQLDALNKSETGSAAAAIKIAALRSYLGTIHAYFALFVSNIHNGKVNLKEHNVMKGILKARELWRLASEMDDVVEDVIEDATTAVHSAEESSDGWASARDEEESLSSISDEEVAEEVDTDDEFAIKVPKVQSGRRASKKTKVNDYNEDEGLDDVELADKKSRKRSLRFYTSKIDQQSTKVTERFSGDADLPYKERHFERQQRLMEEARKRGLKSTKPDAADDFGSDDDDAATGKAVNDGFANDYYDTVQAASRSKKDSRKASHEDAVRAAKEGRLQELAAEDDANGDKRAINYQILKNKGLTPKRNKDNRNSRVKKRKRYEISKKKLSSVRQVYKAPTGAYGGEQTGIKKNLTRSVHFAS